ncbi:MAG TPA: energy transducer TonB [Candidatus Methylacidiphilales bacterium]|jgi:TonB family protein|nr:energy transducer TonB [Candidatus Methylacidiphilales bacterium]
MKHPAGYAKPRRLAAPRKSVRLDLKRRPSPGRDDDVDIEQKSQFWKWVGLVALLHAVVIGLVYWVYETASASKPPEQFISLLPQGDVVKGTPGAQEAHKVGPTTPAPAVHHTPTPPTPSQVQSKPPPPKPVVKTETAPPKPTTPKVKVDLTLANAPAADKPVTKPKPHHKKPPPPKPAADSEDQEASAKPDNAGLSKEQIAEKLGEKLDPAGIKNATQSGTSGSDHSKASPFAEFYAMLHDQVMDQWVVPNLIDDSAVNPVVEIHVEKDGRVPPESVRLVQSSGNPAYDDSALTAAKGLGYLHEPLPDGCPPDISITFKPNR